MFPTVETKIIYLDKTKETKCFKCENFGHVSTKCAKNAESAKTKPRVDAVKSNDKKTYKSVLIYGKCVTAIIDSGSDLHLICFELYKQLNALALDQLSVPIMSDYLINNRTLERFKVNVIIDGLVITFAFDVILDNFGNHDLIISGELC